MAQPEGGCYYKGKLYGAGAGTCAAVPPALVAVYASAEALARGVSAGWWDGESVRLVPAEGWAAVSAVTCQAWCKAEPDGGCGGFMVSHGVCQLRAPVNPNPNP